MRREQHCTQTVCLVPFLSNTALRTLGVGHCDTIPSAEEFLMLICAQDVLCSVYESRHSAAWSW